MATPQTQQRSSAPAAPSRMSLAAVTRGRIEAPLRVLLVGVEGVGKSTFGAAAPAPIFLASEDGTAQLDIARFPQPQTWAEVIDAVRVLATEAHEYQTLVVDTLDWLEPLIWKFICERDGKASIEDYGYGKGHVAALDEWRRFLAALERLRKAKSMTVVLLAHAQIRPFKNPEGEDYDRFELKLNAKAGGLIKEWTDCNLFANHETYAVEKKGRTRGVSSGARVIHTQRRAAWDAKNRHDLPEQLPLSWEDFAEAIAAHRPADPAKLREAIAANVAKLGDEAVTKWVAEKAPTADAAALAKINDRLTAKLAEKEQANAA